jgi:hypothetical protein
MFGRQIGARPRLLHDTKQFPHEGIVERISTAGQRFRRRLTSGDGLQTM